MFLNTRVVTILQLRGLDHTFHTIFEVSSVRMMPMSDELGAISKHR